MSRSLYDGSYTHYHFTWTIDGWDFSILTKTHNVRIVTRKLSCFSNRRSLIKVEAKVTGGGKTGLRGEVRIDLFPKPGDQLDWLPELI